MITEGEMLKLSGVAALNPVQKKSVEAGVLNGDSVVVSAPTASGKTLIAELAMLRCVLEKKKKAVYIVPLRALASEKYESFKEKYEKLGIKVAISVGDYDSSDPWLEKYDVIVLTSEKFDSLLRRDVAWISSVGLVIADEIHIIGDINRGPTMEVLLTKLKKLTNAQFVALSATIKNVREIAEWLDAKAVESDYRPVKLYEGVYSDGKIGFFGKSPVELIGDELPETKIMLDTIKINKQALVFVATRKSAEATAERLSEAVKKALSAGDAVELNKLAGTALDALEYPTRQCGRLAKCITGGIAFHHAGLVAKQRKLIENAFKSNLIKGIVATPTLAQGMNLPAHRVIIRDAKRFYALTGWSYIPVLDYQQMCLPYGAKILMSDGSLISIGEIVNKKINKKVISYNFNKKEFEFQPVLDHFTRTTENLIEIKYDNHKITVTPDHPLLIKKGKKEEWVPAKNVFNGEGLAAIKNFDYEEGKNLCFFKFLPLEHVYLRNKTDLFSLIKPMYKRKDLAKILGKKLKTVKEYVRGKKAIPLSVILKICELLNLSDDAISERIKEIKSAYGNVIRLPKFINKDFMWLVGIIATDGNLNKIKDKITGSIYCKIRIFNKNKKIIQKSIRIIKYLGLENTYINEKNSCTTIEVGCSLLAEILEKFGVPSKMKSYKLSVPDFFYSMDRTLIGSYITGVFDGDDCYTENKGKSISRRVLFCTASKKFAYGLHNLLLRLGIFSKIEVRKPCKPRLIRGKMITFKAKIFNVVFGKISDIKRFNRFIFPSKYLISEPEYENYNNMNKFYSEKNDSNIHWCTISSIKKIKRVSEVYNLSVKNNQNFIANNILVHNCGRAGRPQYDTHGESILIAKSFPEAEELTERYIMGETEEIYSKLASEPVLRVHVLALIASETCSSMRSVYDFFSRTFYGLQYGSSSELSEKIDSIIDFLKERGFISKHADKIRATAVGKRVSELYIDPETAARIIDGVMASKNAEVDGSALIELMTNTIEMMPYLPVKSGEFKGLYAKLNDAELLHKIPDEWDYDYENFLKAFKTSLMVCDWSDEVTEERIYESYGITPGELHSKISILGWLFYSAQEIAMLLGAKGVIKDLRKTRARVVYGIREELLPLVKLRDIGRFRARKLFDAGFTSIKKLREAPELTISTLIGPNVAKSVKKQLSGKEGGGKKEIKSLADYSEQNRI